MKNRTLIGLFIILATIYGLTQLFSGKRDRSFRANLVTIDTAKVTSIILIPKGSATEIALLRENKEWIASNSQINVKAQVEAVNAVLANLTNIETNQVVAKDPAQWATYEVQQKQGTHVRVYQNKKLLSDFILGKLDFNPQMQTAIAYLRLNGENEVYAINGFQTMNFAQDFNAFRNRNLLKMNAVEEITDFNYQAQDTTFHFSKTNQGWQVGNRILDSTQVEAYLNVLRNISGEAFADDFDEVQGSKLLYQSLSLKGKNIEDSLVIHCFRDTTRQPAFVIQSNQNPEAFFASDSTGIYMQIFNKVNDFATNKPAPKPLKQ